MVKTLRYLAGLLRTMRQLPARGLQRLRPVLTRQHVADSGRGPSRTSGERPRASLSAVKVADPRRANAATGRRRRTNKWGAVLPSVPAGRLFDERARSNMSDRIDRELLAGHGDEA